MLGNLRSIALAAALAMPHAVLGQGAAQSVGEPLPTGAAAPAPVAEPAPRPRRLAAIKSWAYQLQKADPYEIAASPFDLVVIDLTKNGNAERPLKPTELARMKKKPDGSRRIVLAYVSVGEAEDYRFYWDDEWTETPTPEVLAEAAAAERAAAGLPPLTPAVPAPAVETPAPASAAPPTPLPPAPALAAGTPASPPPATEKPVRWLTAKAPPWLGDENENWRGNFAVKYWDKGWQDLIFGAPNSYLDRVIAAGFDGIYLDRVDAHYEYLHERRADDEMADFVIRLAAAARAKRPDFIVVPQNGEELLLKPDYVAAIDGIAKEDLFFGHPSQGERNSGAQVANSLSWLAPAKGAGLPVLVIEYLDKQPEMDEALNLILDREFVPYFGPRELDRLVKPGKRAAAAVPISPAAAAAAGATAATAARTEPRTPAKAKKKRRR